MIAGFTYLLSDHDPLAHELTHGGVCTDCDLALMRDIRLLLARRYCAYLILREANMWKECMHA